MTNCFSIMQDQFYTCLLPNREFDNVTLVSKIISHFEPKDAIQSIVYINVCRKYVSLHSDKFLLKMMQPDFAKSG